MNDEKFHIVMAERAERAKRKTDDIHARELAAMRLRAERAEHFVRIIAGLRPGHIGESEAGQLVRTAQATLQPITPKGTQ